MAETADINIPSWLIPAALIVILLNVWLVFSPAIHYGASPLDDPANVLENPHLSRPLLKSLPDIWSGPYQGLYIPVTYTTWAVLKSVSRAIGDGDSFMMLCHLMNIFVHMINILLVIWIGWRFSHSIWVTILSGSIFAFHRVQVEPVVWITGLKDLLSTMFALVTIALLARLWQMDRDENTPESSSGFAPYVFSVFTLVAAVLSKPSMVIVPVVILVMTGMQRRRLSIRESLPLLPHFTIAGVITVFTMNLQPGADIDVQISALHRIPLALNTLGFYLKQLFVPGDLSLVYGRTVEQVIESSGYYLLAAIPVVLVAVLVILRFVVKLKCRCLGPVLIFLVWLLPVSGILTFGYMENSMTADRYMYPALMALSLVIGKQHQWKNKLHLYSLAILLVIIGILHTHNTTADQVTKWQNPESLFRHALTINSKNPLAHKILGEICYLKNDTDGALLHYKQAIEHDPDDLESYNELGNVLVAMDKPENAEYWYRRALELNPDSWQTAVNLGNAYMAMNRFQDAERQYLHALKSKSDLYEVYSNLGLIYRKTRRETDAERAFMKAHELDPDAWEPLNNLGNLYYMTGNIDRARAFYAQAFNANSSTYETHCNLANTSMDRGEIDTAISYYRSGLALYPEYYPARINLAVCLENRNNFAGAIAEYERIRDQFESAGTASPVKGIGDKISQLQLMADQAMSASE